nr:MAG: hypothetical protein [Plasmopara viticola lesion associated narnavirus 1]
MESGYLRLRRKYPLFSHVRRIRTQRESRGCAQKRVMPSLSRKDLQSKPILTVLFSTLTGLIGPRPFRLHTVQRRRPQSPRSSQRLLLGLSSASLTLRSRSTRSHSPTFLSRRRCDSKSRKRFLFPISRLALALSRTRNKRLWSGLISFLPSLPSTQ